MNRIYRSISLPILALSMVFSMVTLADAQRRNDRDIRDAVRSLNSKIEDFEYNLRFQMQSASASRARLSEITDHIRGLRDSVRRFEDNLGRRRENRDDVTAIVDAARRIEDFLQSNPQNRRVQDEWMAVRGQIDRLSANYGLSNVWDAVDEPDTDDYPTVPATRNPSPSSGALSVGLSGTYDLDLTRSESVDDIVSDTRLGTDQSDDLREKLTAPQQIAIDIRGNQVTLATSNAAPVTFTAHGRDKVERTATGKTIRLRATLRGQDLIVSSLGGETDYTITFTSVSNGRGMKVSRRITTEYLKQTVFAESVYNKTDAVARLDLGGRGNANDRDDAYSDNDPTGSTYPAAAGITPGNFIVPNGAIITGVLENEINTKYSQNNDRFRMTVQSPVEFRGATIEGYISGVGRSGRVTGRSNVTFNFESITLRNGQRYDFAGVIQGIKDPYGKNVRVDNEGTAKSDDQTKESAKRGGIGAGLGAVIGAIAGGAKGAVIGAVIGAGGGAGTVAAEGREDIRLQIGSTVTVQSSSPNQRHLRDR